MKLRNYYRPILLIPMSFCLLLTGCFIVDPSSVNNTNHEARESFEYEIDIGSQSLFRISGINGRIDIAGKVGLSQVRVWGEKIVRSDSDTDAEAHLDVLKVIITSDGDEVFVYTEQPRNTHGRNYQIAYHVEIPESWRVCAENTNGDIDIDEIASDVGVGLTNGDIGLSHIQGDVNAGITNGEIDMESIQGSVDAGVTNGRIRGDVTLPSEGVCRLGVTNGEIDLGIPRNTSAQFSARVTNGSIRVSNLAIQNIVTTRRSTTGTLGEGNGSITLSVKNGDIDVGGI